MKHHFISAALAATALLLGASPSFCVESNMDTDAPATVQKSRANQKEIDAQKREIAAKRKANSKIKLVDINSATKDQLKKLPGVGDPEAEKIIAGRPYGSKYWLVTNNIIPEGLFNSIKMRIEAKQPFKDGAKNVEYLKKAAEKKKEAADMKAGDKEADGKKK